MLTPDESGASVTFDLRADLLDRLRSYQARNAIRSLSAAVRQALLRHDFNRLPTSSRKHRQISVRLPVALKTQLFRLARQKGLSVGALLRNALGALPASNGKVILSPPLTTMPKKKAKKKKK
jgi:hypothetical protein